MKNRFTAALAAVGVGSLRTADAFSTQIGEMYNLKQLRRHATTILSVASQNRNSNLVRKKKKYSFLSDQDQLDIHRADIKNTWTPADIQLYRPPPSLGDETIHAKQMIPSPGLKYGKPTMEQTPQEILDQIGAVATKQIPASRRYFTESPFLNDPRFGPKYPPWIQDC